MRNGTLSHAGHIQVSFKVCEGNMFARCRDNLKYMSYWGSVDGKYENQWTRKRQCLCKPNFEPHWIKTGEEQKFDDNEVVKLLVTWTSKAREPSWKYKGTSDIDYIDFPNTDEDLNYKVSSSVDADVSRIINVRLKRERITLV